MSKKGTTASIWMNEQELARYQALADARGVSISQLFKQSTDQALASTDATQDMRAFAADLRADLSRVLERLLEADALQAQERARFLDEQRHVLGNFLSDLKASQREAVKEAFLYGQTKPRTAAPADHGHHSVPQLKGNQ
ncbi:hypothetical protein [Thauera sp. Sel9]|uniref:hypothetical protein n=1 Tax=Thauera sp. Sel9 TaxID=2974299 RepID=UPI0021E1A5D6|nr:hypothetical protein [Thauera sp. Sel9]MCV2216142.1 hypothetical protein [Thauera sp. Sel9]